MTIFQNRSNYDDIKNQHFYSKMSKTVTYSIAIMFFKTLKKKGKF